jgi:hypothetical protein
MENTRLRERAPTAVNVTVGRRVRDYLTEREVERLIEAAKQNRCGHRDATIILVAYRHGLPFTSSRGFFIAASIPAAWRCWRRCAAPYVCYPLPL